jgi:hypothetical protein
MLGKQRLSWIRGTLKGWKIVREWSNGRTATFDMAYPQAVCISIDADKIEIFLPVFDWPHPHEITQAFKLFKSLPAAATAHEVREAVKAAVDTREATFEVCTGCERLVPPEQGGSRCHSCMERLDGCVF